MATVEQQVFTPEDLLKMPDGKHFELVDGELVETGMSLQSAWVATAVSQRLVEVVRSQQLGNVFSETASYRCFPDAPGNVRRPDGSFIRKGRLSEDQFREGHCLIAPDLVVEVVSPHDLYYEVEHKVTEYLNAGVRLVWVFNPNERTVRVFGADGSVQQKGEDDELDGGDVVPGFHVRVGELFPPADLSELL
jgi:Uma2 family endonuclease